MWSTLMPCFVVKSFSSVILPLNIDLSRGSPHAYAVGLAVQSAPARQYSAPVGLETVWYDSSGSIRCQGFRSSDCTLLIRNIKNTGSTLLRLERQSSLYSNWAATICLWNCVLRSNVMQY